MERDVKEKPAAAGAIRGRGLNRREFLKYAVAGAAGAGGLILAGCASQTTGGGGAAPAAEATKAAFDPATELKGLVMVTSLRGGGLSLCIDLEQQRMLGTINWRQVRGSEKAAPHHCTPIPTDNPHAGFIALQTCRSTNETYIVEYKPRDPSNPQLGGEYKPKENLLAKYGIPTNHHAVLRSDKSMWAASDDLYDVLWFIPTQEPYAPLAGLAFRAEKDKDGKVTRAWVEELKPGADGKYTPPEPEKGAKFGAHRCDYGTWTVDGKWFIQGSRNIGYNWVIDPNTWKVVAVFPSAEGGSVEYVDPNDPMKGINVGKTTITHGIGCSNDSKYLLVQDMKGNATQIVDISDADPKKWKEVARVKWPGDSTVNPYHVNFSRDGKYAIVALRAYDSYKPGTGGTGIISMEDFKIVKICEMPGMVEPHGIAVTPDGKYFIQSYAGWDTSGGGHVVWSLDTLEPVYKMPIAVGAHESVLVQTSKMNNGC